MREIKFRAWDKKRKRMYQVNDIDGLIQNTWVCPKGSDDGNWEDEVELMQYIGLKDKNGKEIYEGDILKLDSWAGLQKVDFIDGAFCLMSARGNNGYSSDIHYIHHAGIPQATVMGNIYENPEFLKG